ncbi:MAG TPA: DUF5996 family protein [Longimicrobiaceae bacterium]|nr:DUF5996 family protein [Longimicrobiaceae bacterium]
MSESPAAEAVWPSLPLAEWEDTRATLHLWTQVVGKVRLAQSPWVNHWWHVPLYVTPRGLTSGAMPYGSRSFEVAFDFVDHRLRIDTGDGAEHGFPLEPRSVADFHRELMAELRRIGIEPRIWPVPVELPDPVPFPEDHAHASYDPVHARRFHRALVQVDRVLREFRSGFVGKCSPVHFFWGSFDMAVTRFSGRPAPPHPGGVPGLADRVVREAYSHEVSSAGWWPGGGAVPEAAFYAYMYPEPAGYAEARVRPDSARYLPEMGEWILPHEAVRAAADPDAAVRAFLEDTYAAGAGLAGWDRAALERAG